MVGGLDVDVKLFEMAVEIRVRLQFLKREKSWKKPPQKSVRRVSERDPRFIHLSLDKNL